MSREILFRGKRIDDGEWVIGDFEHFYLPDGELVVYIGNWGKSIDKVFPETVGQYTGLTDKNGKKIFEGDVLHVHSDTCDYDFHTTVGAKYGYISGFYVDGDFDGGDFHEIGLAMDWWENEDATVEIIGNIHDNPELLKGDKNDKA